MRDKAGSGRRQTKGGGDGGSHPLRGLRGKNRVRRRIESGSKEPGGLPTFLQNMPVMVAVFGSGGDIAAWNHECERVTGYKAGEMVGNPKAVNRLFPGGKYRKEIMGQLSNRISGRQRFEWEMTCLDGSVKTIVWSVTPASVRSRGVTKLGTGINVTELKQTQKELSKFQQMADLANHGCALADTKGNLTYVNEAFAGMHGYKPSEVIGKSLEVFHTPRQIRIVRKLNRRLVALGEQLENAEVWHVHRDGREFPTVMSTWSLRDDRGRPWLICATATDISVRKSAEAALVESNKTMEAMLNASVDLIMLIDTDFRFIDMNENVAKRFGIERGKLIGRYVADFVVPEVVKQRMANLNVCVRTRKPVSFEDESRGTIFHNTFYPVLDNKGKVTRLVVYAKDITESKRLEAEASGFRERIYTLQRQAYIDSVGAIMAHQVNQPLTIVTMLLGQAIESMQSRHPNIKSVLKNLKEGLKAARNAVSAVTRLRQYTREWLKGGTERFSLNVIAHHIISTLEEKANRAKMHIILKAMDVLPKVQGHKAAVEQIFLNIMQNAVEAADGCRQHHLTISGKDADDRIKLRFSDDCCGIVSKNIEKVFEPFFSTKSGAKGEGLGLGLPIVRQMLMASGGAIRVESKLGKGTTFYVELPKSFSFGQ